MKRIHLDEYAWHKRYGLFRHGLTSCVLYMSFIIIMFCAQAYVDPYRNTLEDHPPTSRQIIPYESFPFRTHQQQIMAGSLKKLSEVSNGDSIHIAYVVRMSTEDQVPRNLVRT